MSKNFLIPTPIKKIWPKNRSENLIFVSESALLSFNSTQKKYSSYKVNQSRWTNKKNFSSDFKYLIKLYKKYLILISKELNVYHKKNFSLRFWKILLGPWLSTFIHIYFERWHNVKTAINNNKIDKCILLKLENKPFIPYDHENFFYFSQNDLWNQFLYQNIIKSLFKKKIEYKKISLQYVRQELNNPIYNKFYKKKNRLDLKRIIMNLFNFFNHKNYAFFLHNTYLGFKNELKLSLKLNQLPVFSYKDYNHQQKNIDLNIRSKIASLGSKKNLFEKNLIKMLGTIFPKIFLENYSDLENFSKLANLPQNPKVIFTSNSLWYDTKISYHIAKLIQNKKSKLVYGQHGGGMGLVKHHWPEAHEIDISDSFLSWGWKNKKNKKIKKFFILKHLKKLNLKKENLLIPLYNRKRYFHSLESSSGIESYISYIKNIELLLKNLNKNVIKKIILRLPYKNLDIKEVDFFSTLQKNYNFYSLDSFNKACEKSKLVIHPTNSTPLLETLSANIPSILIIDKYHHPIRKDCKKYFELLNERNIIFYKNDLAAKFINKIWNNDTENWWNNSKTQKAIKLFCDHYANKSYNIVDQCYNFLKKI